MCRWLALTLAFFLPGLAAGSLAAEPVLTFSRIRQEFRTDASFKRIGEYFSGLESTGKRLVFRTVEDERDGYYFSFRLSGERRVAIPAGTLVLEFYPPGEFEPTRHTFALDERKSRSLEILVGLTGTDWTDPTARPVAWKLEFLDPEGRSLGAEESFLWKLPNEETE